MRNVLRSHEEVAHFWANEVQESGRSGNMFFVNGTIYSYGTHFPIASHFESSGIILFTVDGYSSSTGKHKSIVSRSIPHDKSIINCKLLYDGKPKVPESLKYFKDTIKDLMEKQARAKSTNYSNTILSEIENAQKFITLVMPYDSTNLIKDTSELLAYLSECSEAIKNNDLSKVKEAIKIESEKAKAKELEKVKVWLEGGYMGMPNGTYCRISEDGQSVETTKRASVPIAEAKTLWNLIKHGKNIHGVKCGYYTVLSYVNDVLTIGCHKIPKKEVERIGKLLEAV